MHFEVDRRDIQVTRVREIEPEPLAPGRARLRLEAFALTANNITYGVFGDALHYWDFFPVTDDDAGRWGRIPVWGFAEVVESRSDAAPVGARVYGFLPMATELVVEPGRADERGFSDVAAHRAPMAGVYNRYVFVDRDPLYDPARERHQMLLYPLFVTSFVADDFLGDHALFGATQVAISSASSRTAIGVAYLVSRRPDVEVVALTSAGNREFVERLGCYSRTLEYGDAALLSPVPSVYVDIAGNRDVTNAVHERLRDLLGHSMVIGNTHWAHTSEAPPPAHGPRPEFLFAPAHVAKRVGEWGQAEWDRRLRDAWKAYADWTDGWIEFHTAHGADRLAATYRAIADGHSDPRVGQLVVPAA